MWLERACGLREVSGRVAQEVVADSRYVRAQGMLQGAELVKREVGMPPPLEDEGMMKVMMMEIEEEKDKEEEKEKEKRGVASVDSLGEGVWCRGRDEERERQRER